MILTRRNFETKEVTIVKEPKVKEIKIESKVKKDKSKVLDKKEDRLESCRNWIRENIHSKDVSYEQIVKTFNVDMEDVKFFVDSYNTTVDKDERVKRLSDWVDNYYTTTDISNKEISNHFGFSTFILYKDTRSKNLYKRGTYKEVKKKNEEKKKQKIIDKPKRNVDFTANNVFNKIILDQRQMLKKTCPDLYFFLFKKYYGQLSKKELSDKFWLTEDTIEHAMSILNVGGYYDHKFTPKQIKFIKTKYISSNLSIKEVVNMELFKNVSKTEFNRFLGKF